MARDRRTRIGARAPGAESNPTPRRCIEESSARHRTGQPNLTMRCEKDTAKPGVHRRMPGGGLSEGCTGKALSDMPAFQPYWGKPAVRNDRGDSGNVGIIRSPLRATVLPDSEGVRQLTSLPRPERIPAARGTALLKSPRPWKIPRTRGQLHGVEIREANRRYFWCWSSSLHPFGQFICLSVL